MARVLKTKAKCAPQRGSSALLCAPHSAGGTADSSQTAAASILPVLFFLVDFSASDCGFWSFLSDSDGVHGLCFYSLLSSFSLSILVLSVSFALSFSFAFLLALLFPRLFHLLTCLLLHLPFLESSLRDLVKKEALPLQATALPG